MIVPKAPKIKVLQESAVNLTRVCFLSLLCRQTLCPSYVWNDNDHLKPLEKSGDNAHYASVYLTNLQPQQSSFVWWIYIVSISKKKKKYLQVWICVMTEKFFLSPSVVWKGVTLQSSWFFEETPVSGCILISWSHQKLAIKTTGWLISPQTV